MPSYRLDDQVGFLLRKANQRHRALFGRMMRPRLPPTQFAAMATLQRYGPLSQNRLGRIAAMDSATIFGVVSRLVERGLVTTERSDHDARLSIVSLTAAGEGLLSELYPTAREVTAATLAPLDVREQRQLLALLARIADDEPVDDLIDGAG
jgi:MarR family transcriptional regulator, lower aerobic nicotinate degradation pathway regulator